MRFDLIIPTYNNLAELKQCIAALGKQSYTNFRALICVDGSTDGTLDWLCSLNLSFDVVILEHDDKKNHGRNPTRNLSLPHIKSDYVCFIDSDIIPQPDFIEQHHRLLSKQDCISVGDVQYTNAYTNAWAAYLQTRGKNKYMDGDEIPYYYLITQNCAHRARYFVEVGGQDSAITKYGGGDTEYAIRLHKTFDLPTIFNARALGYSEMNKSLDEALDQLEKFAATNLHYIHRKHPDVTEIFALRWLTHYAPLLSKFLNFLGVNRIQSPKRASILTKKISTKLTHLRVLSRLCKGWQEPQEPF